jgi:uncharacterized protein YajQ (UPF0234 family)
MPTFDIVSRTDLAEVDNAVNGVMREISQRFDFKDSKCSVQRTETKLTILADDDMKLRQVHELLATYLTRRQVDAKALDYKTPERATGDTLRQTGEVRQGVDRELSAKIVKAIKASKLKAQVAVQGDELRITGKKRDDLQEVIALVKEMDVDQPLQYVNFRD